LALFSFEGDMASSEEREKNNKLLVRRTGVVNPEDEYVNQVSTPIVVPLPKTQELLPLTRQDWYKIKKLLDSVGNSSAIYQNIAFVWAGMFPTATSFLITLYLSQNVRQWMWILAWVLTLISPLLFVAFYVTSRKLEKFMASSIEAIKAEMDYMENKYEWPQLENTVGTPDEQSP
jgi:hypothetical protein